MPRTRIDEGYEKLITADRIGVENRAPGLTVNFRFSPSKDQSEFPFLTSIKTGTANYYPVRLVARKSEIYLNCGRRSCRFYRRYSLFFDKPIYQVAPDRLTDPRISQKQ